MSKRRAIVLAGLLALLVACSGEPALTEQQARGRELYVANCAGCHGAQGEGAPNWQQPLPNGTYPAPPHDGSGHTWHHPDALLLAITAKGGQSAGSGMPAFEDKLTRDEMEAILAYLKSLWSAEQRAAQEDISRRFEQGAP